MNAFFPVVVIGAGPAGSAATLYLAQMGIKPLLVDKSSFPRDKTCGDGIPFKTFRLLQDLGFQEEELFENGYRIRHMHIYGPNNSAVSFGKWQADAGTKSGCIPRWVFDNLLFQKARQQAEQVWQNHKFIALQRNDPYLVLELEDVKTGTRRQVTTLLVIGADGAKSRLARYVGLSRNHFDHHFDGVRQYFSTSVLEPAVHIFYDRRILPGYLWIFPVAERRANVGMMIDRACKKRWGKPITEIFYTIIRSNPAVRRVLKGARPEGPLRGAPLPLGTLPGKRIGDGILLIGDAAAFINPITGGGLYHAIASARQAAMVASRAVRLNQTREKDLMAYEKWWRQEILPGFIYAHWLKCLFRSEVFLRWFFRKCQHSRRWSLFFMAVYGRPLPRFFWLNPRFWFWILRG